jgi:hypothetical protein
MNTTPFDAPRFPKAGQTTQVDTTGILRPIPTSTTTSNNSFTNAGRSFAPSVGGTSQIDPNTGKLLYSQKADGSIYNKADGSGTEFGANIQTAQLGFNVIQGVGNYLAVREQNKIARDTFEFNKKNLNRDYEQRLKDYNRRVANSDRLSAGNLGFGNTKDFIAERDNGSTFVNDSRPKPQSGNSRKLKKLPSRKDK